MIPILFEDKDILAVNKPGGIASIPERREGKECLLSLLSSKFKEKLCVVHRLDKEVSGVILFAKNAASHKHLNDQFSNRLVKKTYVALTHGVITEESGVIDKPIRQFGSGRMGVDLQRGKSSVTEFHVTERLGAYTLVKVHTLTGRRHQIRVHFYSIGHPIVGDLRYGDKALQQQFPCLPSGGQACLMLHAQEITFQLLSGEKITIESTIPESFDMVIEKINKCKSQK